MKKNGGLIKRKADQLVEENDEKNQNENEDDGDLRKYDLANMVIILKYFIFSNKAKQTKQNNKQKNKQNK